MQKRVNYIPKFWIIILMGYILLDKIVIVSQGNISSSTDVGQIFVININAFASDLVYNLEINIQSKKKNKILLHHLLFVNLFYILNSYWNQKGDLKSDRVKQLLIARLQKQYDRELNLQFIKFSSILSSQL